jgi:hypothetical protein
MDSQGTIDYHITVLVKSDTTDGPNNVLACPGLPIFGSWWINSNDVDLWAWCRWDRTVKPVVTQEPNKFWEVGLLFSSKLPEMEDRPYKDSPVQDPTNEPAKVQGALSGSFVNYQEEFVYDIYGNPLVNSAWEQLRGPQVQFDRSRPKVTIEMNVQQLQLDVLAQSVDTVNANPLWGLPPRTIKLTTADWERKFVGQGDYYYTWKLHFDINYSTWDKLLLDEGTKVLNGKWDPKGDNWILLNIGAINAPGGLTAAPQCNASGAGLTPGTTYSYQVAAVDANGNTTDPSPIVTSLPPASSFGCIPSILLNWNAVKGASSYNVYGRVAGSIGLLKNVGVASYLDNGNDTPSGGIPVGNTTGRIPSQANPQDFIRWVDRKDNPMRGLLYNGLPANVNIIANGVSQGKTGQGQLFVQAYNATAFETLGIPLVF